jgi:hypothetical protein
MWNPITAFVWEWWRTTRRPLSFFVALGGLSGWAILSRIGAADVARGAFVVFMLLASVATLAWVALLARTSRTGFPMPLAYAMPVRTRMLVAVPMAYLAVACAATYAVPATALRLALGAPFPVAPVAVLLAAGAVLFAACNWSTRNNVARFGVSIILLGGIAPVLRWIDPWNPQAGGSQFPPPLTVDSLRLDFADYAAIALAVTLAYVATVRGVEVQRHGDGAARGRHSILPAANRIATRGFVEQVRDVVLAAARMRCPTSSPLAAELWSEVTARGLPVVAIGALSALALPLAFVFGKGAMGPVALGFVFFVPVLPLFAAVSVSFWNRQSSLRAPMSAFEAARPVSTAQLLTVQIGVAVAAIVASWCLIAASAWWSLPLMGDAVDYRALESGMAHAVTAASYGQLAAWAFVSLAALSAAVALLAALRALTVLYGMRIWIGIVALLLYLWLVMFAVILKWLGTAAIGVHLWAFALAIPLGTSWVLVRAVTDASLRPKQAAFLCASWALFVTALAFLAGGAALDGLAAPVTAIVLAVVLLPLTFGALAVWSFGRIRHA